MEIQINVIVLQSKTIFTDNLFRAELSFCNFNNNSIEILGQRQQEGILISIRGEYINLI